MAPPEVTGRKPAARQGAGPSSQHLPRGPPSLRLITYKELKPLKGIPYSRSEIRRKEAAGQFPKRITLAEGDGALIAWVEHEIDAYIAARMAARDAAKTAVPADAEQTA